LACLRTTSEWRDALLGEKPEAAQAPTARPIVAGPVVVAGVEERDSSWLQGVLRWIALAWRRNRKAAD